MKSFKNLYLAFFSTIFLLASCTKNETQNRSERFNLMQGRWNWVAQRCLDTNPNGFSPPYSGSYVKFNLDNSGKSYRTDSSYLFPNPYPSFSNYDFNYQLLEGDSIFIKIILSPYGNFYDTCKIDLLNSNQFFFMG